MAIHTETASSGRWEDVTRDMRLTTVTGSFTSTLVIDARPLPLAPSQNEGLFESARRWALPQPGDSPLDIEPGLPEALEQELAAWDRLSDEALLQFEQELD